MSFFKWFIKEHEKTWTHNNNIRKLMVELEIVEKKFEFFWTMSFFDDIIE